MSEHEQKIVGMLVISRMVHAEATCDCGIVDKIICHSRRLCMLDFAMRGWKIKIHRKGRATIVCPTCLERIAREEQERRAAKAAIRKERDAALAKCKAEMARLKGDQGGV